MHTLLNTIRLTDFIAEILHIKAYQKVLINKQRKYQVKSLGFNSDRQRQAATYDDQLLNASDPDDKDGGGDGNEINDELATTYFEEVLLEENQRNIAWLLSEFDPDADQRDELLLTNIIGGN